MSQYSLLEKIVIIAIMLLFVLVVVLPLQGCSPANRSTNPSAGPVSGAQGAVKALYRTNWMLSLATMGVAGSIFAMMMGLSKIGLAGLVASVAATAYTVATIRYSWLVALAGLGVGLLAALAGFVKNKKTIFSFIGGIQEAKDKLYAHGTAFIMKDGKEVPVRDELNSIIGGKLTLEAEKLVKQYKASLEKDDGTSTVETTST